MKKVLLSIAGSILSIVGFAQLNGTYTVNAAQATGGTNYQTFSAAFSALVSQGVSGPVTFNCVQGTYNEQVYLNSSNTISGTSTTNTITFQAAASNTNEVLWQYSSYPLYWYYPNNINNITFKGLHLKTTGASNAIRIYYGSTTNIKFEDNKLSGYTGGGTSSTYSTIYVYYHTANNLIFEGNTIRNGDYAMYGYYPQGTSHISLIDNDIQDFGYMGLYLYGNYRRWTVKDNYIADNGTGYAYAYGLYSYYWGAESELSGNEFNMSANSGGYAMLMYYAQGNSTNPIRVHNNLIYWSNPNSSVYQYGGFFGYGYYTKIYHNTMRVLNSYSSTRAAYLYYTSSAYQGNEFKNNICVSESSGPYTLYTYIYPGALTLSNNVYSSGGGTELYNYDVYTGTNASSIGAWQSGTSQDANSVGAYPNFVSSTNLTPQSATVNNMGTPLGITTDIYGSARSTTVPDPGAIEFSVPTNNAQPEELLNPDAPLCAEDTSVIVVIKNSGLVNLTSLTISHALNGGTATNVNWTGNLAPQALDTVVLVASTSFSNGDNFKVWTSMPNGVQDSAALYDTIAVDLFDGLIGTYSIPGDYATIAAARDALVAAGVCGDVVFNLSPGTYTEQVEFPEISGVSEDATVTFQSLAGNWNSATWTFSSTGTVILNGADWFTFKNLKLVNTNANVVRMPGSSDHVTFEHCWLKGVSLSSSGGTYSLIDVSGMCNDFTLTDNKLEKGSNWLNSQSGSTTDYKENFTIEDNWMKDQSYGYGYLYYIDGMEMHRNRITNDSAFTSTYGYMAAGYWNYVNNFNFTRNYVGATAGYGWYYALYMLNCVGTSNPRSQFANNCMITGNAGMQTAYYTLYMSNCGLVDIYNNSFTHSSNTSTYNVYIASGGAIELKNNNFINYASNASLYVSGAFAVTESDYNNFYNPGGQLIYYGSTFYNTLEDHQNSTGQDMHSVNTDPDWEDLMMCITCNDTIGNAGTVLGSVTDDISGNNRSLLNPDIGAVEYVTPGSFSLGEDDTVCGSEILIEAGPAQSVTWSVSENGGSPQTYTTSSITVAPSGGVPSEYEISVAITTEFCGSGSDDVVMTVVPDAELDESAHLCADENMDLNPGGGGSASYAWSTGASTSSINVSEAGSYTVTKMELGCESEATIDVTKSDAVMILDQDACSDDMPITIDATIANGTSYAWSGGANINSPINEFTDAGTYSVTATDSYGCSSEDEFMLTVLEDPEAAITETHAGNAYFFDGTSSLYVSANTMYYWDFGYLGMTDTGANVSITYPWSDPNELVTYTVTLTVDNGCNTDVTTFEVTPDPLGIDALAEGTFGLYPNPTNENVNFVLASAAGEKGLIEVMDVSGRVLTTQIIAAGQMNGEVNLAELAAGSYLVKVTVDGNSSVNTLIKH